MTNKMISIKTETRVVVVPVECIDFIHEQDGATDVYLKNHNYSRIRTVVKAKKLVKTINRLLKGEKNNG